MLYKQAKTIVTFMNKYIKGLYVVGQYRRYDEQITSLEFVTKKPITYLLDRIRDEFDLDITVLMQEQAGLVISVPTDYGDVLMAFHRAWNNYDYFFMKTMYRMDIVRQNYYKQVANDKGFELHMNALYKNDIQYDLTFLTKACLNNVLGIPNFQIRSELVSDWIGNCLDD